jgi:hypothetical protein
MMRNALLSVHLLAVIVWTPQAPGAPSPVNGG